jgi:hypothetical protein
MAHPDATFPTDPQRIVAYLNDNEPRPNQPAGRLLWLIGIIAFVFLLTQLSGPVGTLALWAAVIGVIIWVTHKRRQAIDLQRSMEQLRELTLLRRHRQACSAAWALIPRVNRHAHLHGHTTLMFASNLMGMNHFDGAIAAQDYLLEHIPNDHPTALLIRLQRVMAYLHTDQLRSADDELRALSRTELPAFPSSLHAAGVLFQQIKTHHHADVLSDYRLDKTTNEAEESDKAPSADEQPRDPIALFAPLGTEAAYPYAMLAVAAHHQDATGLAGRWWTAATRLRPAETLLEDVSEFRVLAGYPPAPSLQTVTEADRVAVGDDRTESA